MRLRALIALLLAALILALGGCGGEPGDLPQRPPGGNVLDQPNVLSAADLRELNRLIEDGNRTTDRVRVAVAIVEKSSGDWEQWTRELATRWAVGDAGRDNGVLIAVDMDRRKTRIEVADGAREILPDRAAEELLDDVLGPGLKEERYRQALSSTIQQIYRRADGSPIPYPRSTAASVVVGVMAFGTGGMLAAILIWPIVVLTRRYRNPARRTPDGGQTAMAEMDRFEREHPGVRVSRTTRQAYLGYRTYYIDMPRPGDQDSVDPTVRTIWVATFPAWLALYQQVPRLYSGSGRPAWGSSWTPAYGSSAGSSSGGGSSFGGGGGFSGGGASGSF
ncbi:TPM domain-containing protein [Rothia kristinae]|uniref:TPM domain-containing protein n=1 Tax=Rothia kristinae TaxID=37923 RepID=A0A7T3CHG4_9MICC|nr:TPM domain-containing protein [Rothia kristinae]QPT54240.1 TPM domain-containing protein [Rothia kristinae]